MGSTQSTWGVLSGRRSKIMIALFFVIGLLAAPALGMPKPAGGVGGGVGGHGGDHYNEKPDPFHFKYGVHAGIIQTLVKKDMVMKVVILRGSIMYTFLMEGSSMLPIMLMVTMGVLSWRSNMMEKHIILIMLGMGMVDMCKPMKNMKINTK